MKTKSLLTILLVQVTLLFAYPPKKITPEEAGNIAVNAYRQKMWNKQKRLKLVAGDLPDYRSVQFELDSLELQGKTLMYIANFQPQGIMWISAYPIDAPVLTYTEFGKYDFKTTKEQLKTDTVYRKSLLDGYDHDLNLMIYKRKLLKQPSKCDSLEKKHRNEWDIYKVTPKNYQYKPPKSNKDTGFLLQSTWHQRAPYWNLCPLTPFGNNSPAGCVSIALSQIMNYHEWPYPRGNGQNYYIHPDLGELGMQFNNPSITYDWIIIPDAAVNDNSPGSLEAAELCFHAGLATNVEYGYSGTGTSDLNGALNRFFNYSTSNRLKKSNFASQSMWLDSLIAEISENRPIFYAGLKNVGEDHAFIIDGYTSDAQEFHVNLGYQNNSLKWYTYAQFSSVMGYDDGFYYRFIIPDKPMTAMTIPYKQDFNNCFAITNGGALPKYLSAQNVSVVNNLGYESSNCLRAIVSNTDKSYFQLKKIDLLSNSREFEPVLKFKYAVREIDGTGFQPALLLNKDSLIIEVSNDNMNSWQKVFSIYQDRHMLCDSFITRTVSLKKFSNQIVNIRFRMVVGEEDRSRVFLIDNLEIFKSYLFTDCESTYPTTVIAEKKEWVLNRGRDFGNIFPTFWSLGIADGFDKSRYFFQAISGTFGQWSSIETPVLTLPFIRGEKSRISFKYKTKQLPETVPISDIRLIIDYPLENNIIGDFKLAMSYPTTGEIKIDATNSEWKNFNIDIPYGHYDKPIRVGIINKTKTLNGVTTNTHLYIDDFMIFPVRTTSKEDDFEQFADIDNTPTKQVFISCYPNPFNPTTSVKFHLPKNSFTSLTIFNAKGQMIKQAVNNNLTAGMHEYVFNGDRYSSGVFFCKLKIDGMDIAVKKILLMK